ncbi:MAG TPA: hypothetical protein VFB32_09515 [Rudaea sp.]|nr:hypothetical protein [Rudaea sp.]
MVLLSVVRRWYFRDGLSIREISRRTKLSRNTIAKYLDSKVVKPKYSRRKTATKLDPFAAELTEWLEGNPRHVSKRRMTVRQMYARLVEGGYAGSYGRVAAFVRAWRRKRDEAARVASFAGFAPVPLGMGAFSFDWNEDRLVIGERNPVHDMRQKLSRTA